MKNPKFLFDSILLQEQLQQLHEQRKNGKLKSKRTARLTKDERRCILTKTDGKCHICGQEVTLANFQADHVVAHIRGGGHIADNYLPACFICNNYRWHYLPQELQLILKIGVWARTEIEKNTVIGKTMAEKFSAKEKRRIQSNHKK